MATRSTPLDSSWPRGLSLHIGDLNRALEQVLEGAQGCSACRSAICARKFRSFQLTFVPMHAAMQRTLGGGRIV